MHACNSTPTLFRIFSIGPYVLSLSLFRPCLASGNIKGKCNSIWVNPWGGSGEAQLLAAPSIQPFGSNQWVFFTQVKFHRNSKHITPPPLRTSRVNPSWEGGRGDRANLHCLQHRATTLRPANEYSYSGKFHRNPTHITPLLRPFPPE